MAKGWVGGNFNLSIEVSNRASQGENIEASTFQVAHDTFEGGIDACINKAGANAATADLPMGGNTHTGLGAPGTPTDTARSGDIINQFPVYVVDTAPSGSGMSIQPTYFTTPATGAMLQVEMSASKPVSDSSTLTMAIRASASTHEVNFNGGDLWPRAMQAGRVHKLIYNGSAWRLQDPAPGAIEVTISTIRGANFGGTSVTVDIHTTVLAHIVYSERQVQVHIPQITVSCHQDTQWIAVDGIDTAFPAVGGGVYVGTTLRKLTSAGTNHNVNIGVATTATGPYVFYEAQSLATMSAEKQVFSGINITYLVSTSTSL